MRVLSGVKHEGGGMCWSVDLAVIYELGFGKPFIPVVLALVYKEL